MTTVLLQYSYIKQRSQFGKQCLFQLSDHVAEESVQPKPKQMENYILRSSGNRYTQASTQFAIHEAQTEPKVIKDTGILHIQGGWPREVDAQDDEVVQRYCRRIMRADNWVSSMKNLLPTMEHFMLQNNAVNIHENFFDDLIATSIVKHYNIRVRNSYMDPQETIRPVRQLSWSPNCSNRLAAAYSFAEFEEHPANASPYSYVWDIGTWLFLMLFDENPNKALSALISPYPLMTIKFNPRDPATLVGGLSTGQVCYWDIRSSDKPMEISHPYFSHRYPVTDTLWIPSKANTEFFSSSINGTVMWWDTRFLNKPSDTLVMDLEDPAREDVVKAVGVTALQYEPTISSKFLAGMENGVVINANRRGKSRVEQLATRFKGYTGPVLGIDRNPAITKSFLTIGDCSAKIWADDTKEGNFFSICTKDVDLSGGCWSRSRCSVFFIINTRGALEAYDILAGLQAPLTSIHVCSGSLRSISPHEDGELVAVGGDNGNIYMLECSEDLTLFTKNDRTLLSNYLDRYGRYEKAYDNRLKEIRLLYGPDLDEIEPVRKGPSKVKLKKERSRDKRKERHTHPEIRTSTKLKSQRTRGKAGARPSDAHLLAAEGDYFRKIETESDKYVDLDEEDVKAAQELLQVRVVLPPKEEEEETEPEKEDPKKDRKPTRRIRSRMRTRRRRSTKEFEEEASEDIDLESIRTQDTKKRSTKILQKSCGTEVCKPEICCKDMEGKSRPKRPKSDKHKLMRTLSVKIKSSLVEDKLLRRLTEQYDEIPERSPAYKKKMLALKDASPTVLRKELEEAKRAVRAWQEKALVGKLSFWTVAKKLKDKSEKILDTEETTEEQEEAEKLVSEETEKQAQRVTDQIARKRRTTRRKLKPEELQKLEEEKQQELWQLIKQKAKECDESEAKDVYPRISAVFVRSSSDELTKKSKEKVAMSD